MAWAVSIVAQVLVARRAVNAVQINWNVEYYRVQPTATATATTANAAKTKIQHKKNVIIIIKTKV